MTRARRGFTFVELLIAGTMFAILMVAIAGHLRGDLMVWRRATTTVEQLQRLRVGLERFERDLSTLIVYEPTGQWPVKPEFSHDHLRAYLVRGIGTSGRVWYATYDVQGSQPAAWTRTFQTLAQAIANIPGTAETLLPDVAHVDVRYSMMAAGPAAPGGNASGGPVTWTSTWTDLAQSPRLIEFTVELGPSWKIPHTVRRVFAVPTGGLTPAQGGTP